MPKTRLFLTLAVLPLFGLAACGGDETEAGAGTAEGVVTDTLVNRDTTQVPVTTPVVTAESSAVVVQADTAIDTDRDTVPLNNPPQ